LISCLIGSPHISPSIGGRQSAGYLHLPVLKLCAVLLAMQRTGSLLLCPHYLPFGPNPDGSDDKNWNQQQ
jgi:hypothetical protein